MNKPTKALILSAALCLSTATAAQQGDASGQPPIDEEIEQTRERLHAFAEYLHRNRAPRKWWFGEGLWGSSWAY